LGWPNHLSKGKGKQQMNRQEVIELVVVRAPSGEQQQLRKLLSTYSTEELARVEQAIISQATQQIAEDELIRIQAEREANRLWHQYETQQAREPKRKAEEKEQLAQDRKTFAEAAKSLRSFGLTEANFSVCRSTLGEGFSGYEIQQMLEANGAILSGPTREELNEWDRQDVEDHNQRLLNSDLPTLRRLAREAGAKGQPPVAPDETQRIRQAERADGTIYLPLPDEFRDGNGPEEPLDAAFIRKCSRETFRILKNRYGMAQLEEALQTRRPDRSPLWQ
jgi:hypothetical protein